jgi:hypothetical protein
MPEKSGMVVEACVPLSAGPTGGVAVCAQVGMTDTREMSPIGAKAITAADFINKPPKNFA